MGSSPQSISGFPEYLPPQQLIFQSWLQVISHNFEKYGSSPIETPAVERLTTLVSKGAAEHEIYTLSRYRGQSQEATEEFGLRFDLTVPLARYVAQHFHALVFPFKRHHIAPVWRGERPQKGRYRQFYQCDVDILGHNTLSVAYDAEVLDILQSTLESLKVGAFVVHLNHKKLLIAILEFFSVPQDSLDLCLKVLDKRLKISPQQFTFEMNAICSQAENLIAFLDQVQGPLIPAVQSLEIHALGYNLKVQEALYDLLGIAKNLPPERLNRITLNLSLVRGLAYYTGVIFETFLSGAPELGSVASGGRYDSLSEQFSQHKTPGVGMSIGVSRLFNYCVLESSITLKKCAKAKILLTTQDRDCLSQYQAFARKIRDEGVFLDHYLEDKPLSQQMKYADKKGFQYIILARAEELAEKDWIVKNLESGAQQTYTESTIVEYLKTL